MSKNPVLIPRPFAVNGSKNSIHDTRQAGQDPEDATWSDGFPNVTMQPVESGGLPPKGMDFNGIFNALSDTAVHLQKGGFFYFDKAYSDSFGGYQTGAILISDDNTKLFISISDNNTNNPNQNTEGWTILAGAGVNADTATKLQTTRRINGVEFDGSADINATPSGAVQFFAMSTAPTGWVKANGAEISRITYANLFAAIGTTFGAGDGKTTFNLPDLRGEFLRGWDDGRGVDTGRALGSYQLDMMAAHSHSFGPYRSANADIGNSITYGAELSTVGLGGEIYGGVSGGSETRPRNIALL
ncbi:Phage Tail Collar Domain, partial [Snodgrassella sp. R-53583]